MRAIDDCIKEDMSKADEMFEELGYELVHYHYSCDNTDTYTYIEKGKNNYLRFNTGNKTFYSLNDKTYNIQELQAINEKCKELGWLDKEI